MIAVGELHKKGIMHRDLKLENILVDEKGYIKIIDYGLAKILNGDELAQSYCGTPEYLAPEMVSQSGHDFTVDWWAVGVLIYEMLVGVTPFFNRNRQVLTSKIKHSKVVFPDRKAYRIDYSDKLVDIVTQLLQKDRTKRLGARGGAAEILNHPFFADVDIAALENYDIEPPFKPKHDKDGNFQEFFNVKEGPAALEDTVLPKDNLRAIKKH